MKWGPQILTNIFNKVKNVKEFPLDWKIAIIHPICKGKGNRKEPDNYRGTSLFSVRGAVFSGILAGRLSDWLRNHKALLEFQTGIVNGRTATDSFFIIKTVKCEYLRAKRRYIYGCFIDLGKAFVTVDREAIWFKRRRK
jgi:hypothetical protein